MMKFCIYHFVLLLLLLVNVRVFSENLGEASVDTEYENRLYNIYKRFHHQSMASQEWDQIVQNQTSDSYSIQKGDNLWDISRTLFGNSNYWPKLWSVNSDITNPHQVSVGQQLYFIMGSESGAPQLGISDTTYDKSGLTEEKEGVTIDVENTDGNEGVMLEGGTISPSSAKRMKSCSPVLSDVLGRPGMTKVYNDDWKCRSVKARLSQRRNKDSQKVRNSFGKPVPVFRQLGKIPTSLPELEMVFSEDRDAGVATAQFPVFPNDSVVLRFVTNKDDVKVVGELKRIEDYLPVVTSEIIVALDVPADAGAIMSLIRPLQKVSSGKISVRDPSGYEVMIQAVIRIKAPVPNQQGNYFAEIQKLYGSVSEQSKVIEGGALFFSMRDTQQWGNGQAQLVGISSDQSSDTLMMHSFVYLNRGTNQNVNKGESFKIWANPQFHQTVGTRPIGEVLVVHASERVSTGFVTNLSREAYVGDFVRPHSSLTSYEFDDQVDDVYEDDEDQQEEDFEETNGFDDEEDFEEEEEEEEIDSQTTEDMDMESSGFDDDSVEQEELEEPSMIEEKEEEMEMEMELDFDDGMSESESQTIEEAGDNDVDMEESSDFDDEIFEQQDSEEREEDMDSSEFEEEEEDFYEE